MTVKELVAELQGYMSRKELSGNEEVWLIDRKDYTVVGELISIKLNDEDLNKDYVGNEPWLMIDTGA